MALVRVIILNLVLIKIYNFDYYKINLGRSLKLRLQFFVIKSFWLGSLASFALMKGNLK